MKITKQNLSQISKKGSLFSKLGTVVVALLFLVFVIVVFFGDDGKLGIAAQKLSEVIKGVPEVDQNQNELNFFRTNDAQIKFVSSWNTDIKNALAGPAPNGGCITSLASLEVDGFYAKGANYNLYLTQTGNDITMSLTRYAKQSYENTNDKTETPVTTAKIEDAQLCVITGAGAVAFYNEFNDINKGDSAPDIKKIAPVPVNHILISSGKEEDRDKKREIGYSNSAAEPTSIADYTWAELFKKSDKTIIYAVRIDDANGKKYVCLFPTYNDFGFGSGCGSPKTSSGTTLMQTDCFDSDAGDDSLKYNFDNKLISPDYICSDKAPVTVPAAPSP